MERSGGLCTPSFGWCGWSGHSPRRLGPCWPEAAVVRVLQGRGVQSVRALIPDPRVLERGFHDATIVDMEDSAEPAVLEDDLSLLRLQWPVTVLWSMVWLQNELDAMHAAAKKRYRNSRPGDCLYCGKWIKYDMYRHVSWCRAHDVPSDIKSASLDNFFPPWTIRHQIWADALKPCHSGVSTDVLLFSKISSRWCTTTGCSGGGCPIMHFARTTSADYGCLCRRRRPWHSVVWCLRFRAARSHRGMFAPVMRRLSLLGRHNVFVAGCSRLDIGTSPYV